MGLLTLALSLGSVRAGGPSILDIIVIDGESGPDVAVRMLFPAVQKLFGM